MFPGFRYKECHICFCSRDSSSTLPFRSTPFSLEWFKATKNLQSLKSKPLQSPLWETGRHYYVNFRNKLSSGKEVPWGLFQLPPCPCLSRPPVVLSGLLQSLLVHMALLKQLSLHSSMMSGNLGLKCHTPLATKTVKGLKKVLLWDPVALEAWCQRKYSIHPSIHPHRTCNCSSSPSAIYPLKPRVLPLLKTPRPVYLCRGSVGKREEEGGSVGKKKFLPPLPEVLTDETTSCYNSESKIKVKFSAKSHTC